MKIAVLGESPADEAAVSILVEGILGVEIERVLFPEPSTRGWMGVFKAIEFILRHLHYRTDVDALVITLDSDESPLHRKGSIDTESCDSKCRLCKLRKRIKTIQTSLRPRQGRGPIRIGLGIAVPAIEAWCLFEKDSHISESSWIQALQSRHFIYTKKSLKQQVYGCSEPSLELETECLVEQARRIIAEKHLEMLEKLFPVGFGSLVEEVRSWRS